MTRDEAIDLLDNLIGMIEDSNGSDYNRAFRMAIEALEKYEEAYEHGWTDAECKYRVRDRGEWKLFPNDFDDSTWECSVCGELFTLIYGTPQDNLYNYCPNCGARLDERREE